MEYDEYLVVINPRRDPVRISLARGLATARPLEVRGVKLAGEDIDADVFSFGIFALG